MRKLGVVVLAGMWVCACGGGGGGGGDATDDQAPVDAGPADAALAALGAACDDGAACGSGFCVDGRCCDTACDDACATCGDDGVCAPRAAGTACRDAAGVCDLPEACDGVALTCPTDALADSGTSCRLAVSECDATEACDGVAVDCAPDAAAAPGATCGTYACVADDVACPTSCDAHADCAAGAACIDGACQAAKWAFTTSGTHNGNFGGLAGADAFCQLHATNAGLPGTYKAWLADNTGAPADRFTQVTVPYIMPAGPLAVIVLATSYADLTDGTIGANFERTEAGVAVPSNIPYTNVTAAGVRYNGGYDCGDWTYAGADALGASGHSQSLNANWTTGNITGCDVVHRLFCFEQ